MFLSLVLNLILIVYFSFQVIDTMILFYVDRLNMLLLEGMKKAHWLHLSCSTSVFLLCSILRAKEWASAQLKSLIRSDISMCFSSGPCLVQKYNTMEIICQLNCPRGGKCSICSDFIKMNLWKQPQIQAKSPLISKSFLFKY